MIAKLSLLENALGYAARKWPVFPCDVNKRPLVKNGFKVATRDEQQIHAWWTQWPTASIGMPTGAASGCWVLDVDMPDGPGSLERLLEVHGELPATLEQHTGGGGRQLFFKWDPARPIRNSAGQIGPGIDVRGEGGYVILPPSGHPSGGRYAWI